MMHSLALRRPTKSLLVRLDKLARRSVKKWLHLPHATSTSYFHAPVPEDGLGIVLLVDRMESLRKKRLWRLFDFDTMRPSG